MPKPFTLIRLTLALHLCILSVAASAQMRVDSFSGPVTTAETESFLQYVSTLQPADSNQGNRWSYGVSGQAVRAMGMVYEIHHDTRLLNQMIRFCDAALLARNDLAPAPIGQHMIWTGRVDPVWPNGFKKEPLSTGGEQGDPVGALGYCALSILQTRSVYNDTIPDNDPHHLGRTYLERAKSFAKGADTAIDGHILSSLLDLSHNGRQYFSAKGPYKSGTPVPWNQQMMFNYGFQNMAAVHLLLHDDAPRAAKYHQIVADSLAWFFSEGQRTTTDKQGRSVYDWGYSMPSTQGEDSTHAAMDIAGFCSSFDTGDYGLTKQQMLPFANTYLDIMTLSPGTFAGRVDGTSGTGHAATTQALRSGYILLAEFRPDAYLQIVSSGLKEHETTDKVDLFSRFLWVKNQLEKSKRSKAPASTTPPSK